MRRLTCHTKCIVATAIEHLEDRYAEAFEGLRYHELSRVDGLRRVAEAEVVRTPDLAARKQAFCDLADAFVVLPGGLGTLEEAIDVLSWSSVGLHSKRVVFLNTSDFYTPFVDFVRRGVEVGMMKADTLQAFALARDIQHCIDILSQ